MSAPAASVVVRCRDEAGTLRRTLDTLRAQTVALEILVVDSGSTDGSLEIARELADRVIEIPPESFTYGHALNVGAGAASADVHFAVSAHCFPPDEGWAQRALAHFARADVAGVGGMATRPDGGPLREPWVQTAADAQRWPEWGYSNHAGAWRAAAWREHPFDEAMDYAEDKEWAWRVLHAGWVLVMAPDLVVDASHQWETSARDWFRRSRLLPRALGGFAPVRAYGLGDLARDWWEVDRAAVRRSPFVHRFLNHRRAAGLLGRYVGHREARRRARG